MNAQLPTDQVLNTTVSAASVHAATDGPESGVNGLDQQFDQTSRTDPDPVSEPLAQPSSPRSVERPDLIVDPGDLPATARELRDLFAASGRSFDRGVPVKIVSAADGGAPTAPQLTPNGIVMEAHELCRPVKMQGEELVSVTLPERVARMYLHLRGEWALRPLAGITTAPVLSTEGTVRAAEGYDPSTGLWCAKVPSLQIPERPTREQAEAALHLLRTVLRTFPFADAPRRKNNDLGVEVVDIGSTRRPGPSRHGLIILNRLIGPVRRIG